MSSVSISKEVPPARSPRKKEKGAGHFWRACRFLYPYRGMVIVSVLCAIFVSAAATSGIGTLLPIMRVLMKGDTIATWADREIAQHRLGIKFAEVEKNARDLLILDIKDESDNAAAQAGLQVHDAIVSDDVIGEPHGATVLRELSDPKLTSATVQIRDRGPLTIPMRP